MSSRPLLRAIALHARGPDDAPLGPSRLVVLPRPAAVDPLALGLALDPRGELAFSASMVPAGSETCARLIVDGASQERLDELGARAAALHPGSRLAAFECAGGFAAGPHALALLEGFSLAEAVPSPRPGGDHAAPRL